LLLLVYLYGGDVKRANEVFQWIGENCESLSPCVKNYLNAMLLMKEGNFKLAEEILVKMLEDETIRDDLEFNLKILISLLKLNYVLGKINNLDKVLGLAEKLVEHVSEPNLRALTFFWISLALDDRIGSFKSLNRAVSELGDEFSEFAWKVYLEVAIYYKVRGIEFKFLSYLEKALGSFNELIRRIRDVSFIESYINDVENEKFYKVLKSLMV